MESTHDGMKFYMRDIRNIPLVDIEEEHELARLIKLGDERARLKLIIANLRLVVKIAHDFKNSGLALQDLISEGNIGLMRAAEKFDPAKGAKFSSYAAWWIKQAMRRALVEKSKTIRIPITSAGKIKKIKSIRINLTEKLGRDPTDQEIAGQTDFSARVVSRLRRSDLKTVSLHEPVSQDRDGWVKDFIPDRDALIPDAVLDETEFAENLNRTLQRLDKRERTILLMRYGLDGTPPKTLEEVSKTIGRTRERVRQIQNKALAKLRLYMREDYRYRQVQFKRLPHILN